MLAVSTDPSTKTTVSYQETNHKNTSEGMSTKRKTKKLPHSRKLGTRRASGAIQKTLPWMDLTPPVVQVPWRVCNASGNKKLESKP